MEISSAEAVVSRTCAQKEQRFKKTFSLFPALSEPLRVTRTQMRSMVDAKPLTCWIS